MGILRILRSLNSPLPQFWPDAKGNLRSATSLLTQICTLFLWRRHVTADPNCGCVAIRNQRFWFWTNEHLIDVDCISHIKVEIDVRRVWFGYLQPDLINDAEKFTVVLCVAEGETVPLWTFKGVHTRVRSGWGFSPFARDGVTTRGGGLGGRADRFAEALAACLGKRVR